MNVQAAMQKPTNPKAAPQGGRVIQRQCPACGAKAAAGGACRGCGARQAQTRGAPSHGAPAQGGGRALEASLQADMGQRFGHDFSRVRVHTDAGAAASARALGALAYTSGTDLVFDEGRFAPHSPAGRRLLAHELAHVVQQSGRTGRAQTQLALSTPGDASERQADAAADAVMERRAVPALDAVPAAVSRTCGPAALGPPSPECAPSTAGVIGHQFLFDVNCDDLKSVEVTPGVFRTGAAAVADFVSTVPAGSTVNVHGFASGEGPAGYNVDLSCHRANKVADLLRAAGLPVARVFKHGGVSLPPSADFWRSATVEVVRPDPGPQNVCGPDVTDWLVDQVALAKRDAAVLAIQSDLASANAMAATLGLSSERLAEGGVATMLEREERRRSPPSSAAFPRPTAAIAAGAAGVSELHRAAAIGVGSILPGGNPSGVLVPVIIGLIRRASLAWKALVGTGQRYDFKSNVLNNPTSPHCPVSCDRSLTLCPSPRGACFNVDVPGNLFYAHVGRFVGFTELSLQLGSQFAQLSASARWDPPEDTAMISAGFGMAHPLSRASLCSAVDSIRGSISRRACMPCPETGTIPFK